MIPALIAAAAEVLGPLLAEGGAAAAAEGGAAAGAARGGAAAARMTKLDKLLAANPKAFAGQGGQYGRPVVGGGGGDHQMTKLEEALSANPPSFGNNGGGGPGNPGRGPGEPAPGPLDRMADTIFSVDPTGITKALARSLGEALPKAIQQGTRLVNNDFGGFFQALDIVPKPIREFVGALQEASRAILNRVEQLRGYSGQLGNASAYRDVKLLQADVREANRLGPAYARATKETTDLEVTLRDAFAPLKEIQADVTAGFANMANNSIKALGIPEALKGIGELWKEFRDTSQEEFRIIAHVYFWWRRKFGIPDEPQKKTEKIPDGLQMLDQMFQGLRRQIPNQHPMGAMPNAKDAPLGIKLIP